MTPPRARRIAALVALAAGLFVAAGVPLGERWHACRAPGSEACVWSKALLPVSLAAGVVLGAIVAAISFAAVRLWQRRRPRPDAG
jgi:hypothetical protein